MVFLHSAQLLFVDCDYPKISLFFTLPNAGFFLYLFNDFYVKAYKRKSSKAELELPEPKKESENGLITANKNGFVTSKKDIGKSSPNTVKKILTNNNHPNEENYSEAKKKKWWGRVLAIFLRAACCMPLFICAIFRVIWNPYTNF